MANWTETAFLRAAIIANGGTCDDLPDNLESTLYKRLIEVCASGGGGGGGGLPAGGDPYKQLVTDGEGNTVWEDRLAYEDPNALTYILPETELEAMGEDGGFAYTQPLGTTLAVGETYAVTYNGATFECPAYDGSALDLPGGVFLGNLEAMLGSGDTGEPFVCVVFPDEMASQAGGSVQCMPMDGASSVTLAISKKGYIRRIPLKFLPKEMYGVEITKEGTLLDIAFVGAGMSHIMFFEDNPIPLSILPGDMYTITWNGVNYQCVAEKENGGTDQNGVTVWAITLKVPDVVTCGVIDHPTFKTPVLTTIQSFDGTSETQITISGREGKIRKVPEQFLPDATGVVLTAPNGTKYKLSVDNQGNLSADALS